jgi:hypothetical protein
MATRMYRPMSAEGDAQVVIDGAPGITPITTPGKTGKKLTAAEILAQNKFKWDKEQDAYDRAFQIEERDYQRGLATAASDQTKKTNKTLLDFYNSGKYDNLDSVLGNITDYETSSKQGIDEETRRALSEIGIGFDLANTKTNTAYDTLDSYLSQPQEDFFGNTAVSNPTVGNDLAQVLSAYGASSPSVDSQLAASNATMADTSSQFKNLLGLLGAITKKSNEGRQVEGKTARTSANEGLLSQRAGYEGGVRSSASNALQQLAQTIAAQKTSAQNASLQNKTNFEQTLAGLGIDVSNSVPPAVTNGPVSRPLVPNEEDSMTELLKNLFPAGMNFGGMGFGVR